MKIEFRSVGDGTNVEVLLLEELGGAEVINDCVYTSDHRGGLHFSENLGVQISARELFEWVEDCWAKPIIGGRYGWLHPYWYEREEKRKRREKLS